MQLFWKAECHFNKTDPYKSYPADSLIHIITRNIASINPGKKKLLIPPEIRYFSAKEKRILDLLDEQWGKKYDSTWDQSSLLWQQIGKLRPSTQRVWLALIYSVIRVNPKYSYYNAQGCIPSITYLIEDLKNPLERALGYKWLGDFLQQYSVYIEAVKSYFETFICIYELDSITPRNKVNAYTVSSTEGLSNILKSQRLWQADNQAKAILNYDASNYYLSIKDTFTGTKVLLSKLVDSTTAYCWTPSRLSSEGKVELLTKLKFLLQQITKIPKGENSTYIVYVSIGQILEKEHKLQQALGYYLAALLQAVLSENQRSIHNSLEAVARVYATLNENILALDYADMNMAFSSRMNSTVDHAHAAILKSQIFNILGKPDSALKYLNELLYNSELFQTLPPTEASILYERALLGKYQVFNNIKKPDSSLYYQSKLDTALIWRQDNYINLQDSMSISRVRLVDAIERRFNRLLQKEFDTEKKLRLTITEQGIEQKWKDSCSIYDLNLLTQQLSDKNVELDSATNRLGRKNSELKNVIEDKTDLEFLLYVIIGVLAVVTVSLVLVSRRAKKLNRQLKAKSTELGNNLIAAENNLSEQRIFKKISDHDIQKLILNIPRVANGNDLGSGSKDISRRLFNNAKAVEKYLRAIFKLTETVSCIQDEVSRATLYADAYTKTSLMGNQKVTFKNEIDDDFVLSNLSIPTLLLNNFVKNAVEHGFPDDYSYELIVTLKHEKSLKGYTLIVEDNGIGINKARDLSNEKTGRGITLIKESIAAFNKSKREYYVVFAEDSLVDKNDLFPKKSGTLAQIFLSKNIAV